MSVCDFELGTDWGREPGLGQLIARVEESGCECVWDCPVMSFLDWPGGGGWFWWFGVLARVCEKGAWDKTWDSCTLDDSLSVCNGEKLIVNGQSKVS